MVGVNGARGCQALSSGVRLRYVEFCAAADQGTVTPKTRDRSLSVFPPGYFIV